MEALSKMRDSYSQSGQPHSADMHASLRTNLSLMVSFMIIYNAFLRIPSDGGGKKMADKNRIAEAVKKLKGISEERREKLLSELDQKLSEKAAAGTFGIAEEMLVTVLKSNMTPEEQKEFDQIPAEK